MLSTEFNLRTRRILASLIAALLAASCSPEREPSSLADTSPHQSLFVQANGLRLHVLDWGGGGEALVLVHGADWSPHHFDDLAPLLTDRFRVIAPARRGHGQSEMPSEPFDVDVLVEDLRQLLDSLRIDKTNLLGTSFAGAEITRFAALYPDRVRKLIYLDAHYERLEPTWSEAAASRPEVPCFSADFASLGTLRKCMQEYLRPDLPWSPPMEAVLMDITRRDTDGFLRLKTQSPLLTSSKLAVNTEYRREYERLQMPVLVLFAERFFPITGTDPDWDRRTLEWHARNYSAVKEGAERRFREAVPNVRMAALPGTAHEEMLYHDPQDLANEIRTFLFDPNRPPDQSGSTR